MGDMYLPLPSTVSERDVVANGQQWLMALESGMKKAAWGEPENGTLQILKACKRRACRECGSRGLLSGCLVFPALDILQINNGKIL